jgi:hypothetical protein
MKSDPEMLRKGTPASPAVALASSVLPAQHYISEMLQYSIEIAAGNAEEGHAGLPCCGCGAQHKSKRMQISRTAISEKKSDSRMLRKGTPASPAVALASSVLPANHWRCTMLQISRTKKQIWHGDAEEGHTRLACCGFGQQRPACRSDTGDNETCQVPQSPLGLATVIAGASYATQPPITSNKLSA